MATIIESFFGNYLLNKLLVFTEGRVGMILGVKDEVNKLKDKMTDIAAYLKDAERKQITNLSVNNWLNKLKDVRYDCDDIIDLWIYKNQSLPCDEQSSSSNSPTCSCFSLFSCFRSVSMRHEVAKQINILNARLDEIFKDMANLNLRHIQSEVPEVGRVSGPVSSLVMEIDIVGNKIEESANKIVKMSITDNKQNFNVIAITGMGGIGKTTLAQKIYNDKRIENGYSHKMWLSVTQSFSLAQLIKEAIGKAVDNLGNAKRKSVLLPILADFSYEKSFFSVLDDVWNCYSVILLLNAIKSKATYGFILVTTRDQRVAMRMGAKYIHQVEVLPPKSAWQLLCKKSYLTNATDIQQFEDVGNKIVEKCGGLPLAITAMVGVLATKKESKNEWEKVLKNSAWSIEGLPEEIHRAFYLSYEDLSPQLKQCFLYCFLYPPNSFIDRDDLVRLWIVEGFVEERSDHIMKNTAEECYNELIRRNFLKSNLLRANNSQCSMHDLFRSLAQYFSKEEVFSGDQVFPDRDVISRICHLSLKKVNEQTSIPGLVTKQLKLRTFIVYNCQSEIESKIFIRHKYLRVLLINEKGLHNIPESIGELIHLRMLDFDRTSISNLPESIGCLTENGGFTHRNGGFTYENSDFDKKKQR